MLKHTPNLLSTKRHSSMIAPYPDAAALLALTADIVAAHVSNNSVDPSGLPGLITSVHGALAALDAEAPVAPVDQAPAVSIVDRLLQGIQNKPGMRRPADPPANDVAGKHVDHERHVEQRRRQCRGHFPKPRARPKLRRK